MSVLINEKSYYLASYNYNNQCYSLDETSHGFKTKEEAIEAADGRAKYTNLPYAVLKIDKICKITPKTTVTTEVIDYTSKEEK